MFATFITLILVPALYNVWEDVKSAVARLVGKDAEAWAGGGQNDAVLPAAAKEEIAEAS